MPVRIFTEEEREEIKLKMLEAGFSLLKQFGMTHTSISKITKSAGIGISTFYNFWKSKEEYMVQLIEYHRQKMLPVLIPEDVIAGKRKLGRDDAKKYLLSVVDEEISIYPNMTLEDESKLFRQTDQFEPNFEKECAVASELLGFAEGVKKDVNLGLIANLAKVLVITSESKDELHESVYSETIDVLIENILNLIFED